MQKVIIILKRVTRALLSPLIYRYHPIGLQPERLQLWLRSVLESRDVPGDILEVGCALCGTSSYTYGMMKRLAIKKNYVCIDTFSGFVKEHFLDDIRLGNTPANRNKFNANSPRLAQKILNLHNAKEVKLVQGDIASVDVKQIPEKLAVVLLDVDLATPTYEGLKRVVPLLSSGGIILIDDCQYTGYEDWQAGRGYARYCVEHGLTESYEYGMGVIRKS